VVIKEVNPLAAPLYLEFAPHVVFLVRHPAAVFLSRVRLGWNESSPGSSGEFGRWYGDVLAQASRLLARSADVHVALYEDVCNAPARTLESLFESTGLRWTAEAAEVVEETTSGTSDPLWGTSRQSALMADSWRGQMDAHSLQSLRAGFDEAGSPFYTRDADW
jgi:hypothetical protein